MSQGVSMDVFTERFDASLFDVGGLGLVNNASTTVENTGVGETGTGDTTSAMLNQLMLQTILWRNLLPIYLALLQPVLRAELDFLLQIGSLLRGWKCFWTPGFVVCLPKGLNW